MPIDTCCKTIRITNTAGYTRRPAKTAEARKARRTRTRARRKRTTEDEEEKDKDEEEAWSSSSSSESSDDEDKEDEDEELVLDHVPGQNPALEVLQKMVRLHEGVHEFKGPDEYTIGAKVVLAQAGECVWGKITKTRTHPKDGFEIQVAVDPDCKELVQAARKPQPSFGWSLLTSVG